VFVAHDQELRREVALKQMRDECVRDPQSRSRFMLEAEITGALEHPGVVPVYALGQHDDGRPYYAMRFIRGESLKDAITHFHESVTPEHKTSEHVLEFRKLLGRFVDACDAIAYAHSRGVLHRDIKPANIMLGPFGETLVVDWGLAKRDAGAPSGEQCGAMTLSNLAKETRHTLPVLRPVRAQGFVALPKRWVVERTIAWLSRYRRHSKDYERNPATSETMIYITMIHIMLRRLERA
jgi:serine/threonine protein kinase